MTGAADDKGNMAEYEYNGLGHRIGMRQGVLEYIGSNATVDFGTDKFVPKVWNKETDYILDFTRKYHNLLQCLLQK